MLEPYYVLENIFFFWCLCLFYDPFGFLEIETKVFLRVLRNQCFNFLICFFTFENEYYGLFATILKFTVAKFTEEFLFYCFHRLLHHRSLYKLLGHNVHHKWVITRAVSTCDASIPDYLLTVLFPAFFSAWITRMCLNELRLWFFLVTWQGLIGHLGKNSYEHSIHHLKRNCNYGPGQRMDKFFGTFRSK
jgi:sterol desaturase/sphingolipid hydroxylase (fatty acid hydroxylase superfamily)